VDGKRSMSRRVKNKEQKEREEGIAAGIGNAEE
jgi:hypothetical protein